MKNNLKLWAYTPLFFLLLTVKIVTAQVTAIENTALQFTQKVCQNKIDIAFANDPAEFGSKGYLATSEHDTVIITIESFGDDSTIYVNRTISDRNTEFSLTFSNKTKKVKKIMIDVTMPASGYTYHYCPFTCKYFGDFGEEIVTVYKQSSHSGNAPVNKEIDAGMFIAEMKRFFIFL